LPGLEGLRAVAALLVVFHHARAHRLWGPLEGWNGVTLFFVLSGFLITTLALREEEALAAHPRRQADGRSRLASRGRDGRGSCARQRLELVEPERLEPRFSSTSAGLSARAARATIARARLPTGCTASTGSTSL
jgi:hypothetical protein